MFLSQSLCKKIDHEIRKFPAEKKQSAVMAALAIVQDEKNWLDSDAIQAIANYLEMPAIAVQEVATFYNMYNTKPVGKYKVSICTNLPCQLSGGERAAEYLKNKLGINFGETTADNNFSLVESECMGACGDAPVLLINNKRMCSDMSHERIDNLLEELKE
jgi:NADH-quinone oxidoreductase subunit E